MSEQIITRDKNDNTFKDKWINLAEKRLGTEVLSCTDDFFASVNNLLNVEHAIFIPGKYTEDGKWMDGWESRRKRTEGHDHCVIRLGLSGIIKGFDVDTNHFTGNHADEISIEAVCLKEGQDPDEHTEWIEIVSKTKMNPGSQHLIEVNNQSRFTHIKLHIYPDGGVARLRVYGEVKRDWSTYSKGDVIDLAAVENEGKAVICNDMYFSSKDNINAPGRGVNMGDGWETKRRRSPGFDWLILALGKRGILSKILLDTIHFKGNFPDSFSLLGANLEVGQSTDLDDKTIKWVEVLPQTKLEAHKEHIIELPQVTNALTHVKIQIYPDGGVSRLRLFGEVAD